jgi:hypothetical protein
VISQLVRIVTEGVSSAFSLYRELTLSSLQLLPQFSSEPGSRAIARRQKLRVVAAPSSFEVTPIRSRTPHPQY